MYKIEGLIPHYFDIETTGLSGLEDDFVCAVVRNEEHFYEFLELDAFFGFIKNLKGAVLVGYRTQNYRGGFDLPFLRTLAIRNNLTNEWPFKGIRHLDMLPVVQNHISTSVYDVKLPSKSSLRKDDLVELAFANSIKYTTTKDTYKRLMELEEEEGCDWCGRDEITTSESNSLQDVYVRFFDPKKEEEYPYIDVGELIDQYKKGDISYKEFEKTQLTHCANDVRRLQVITENFLPMIPEYLMNRNIMNL
jgi:hypothetical protein